MGKEKKKVIMARIITYTLKCATGTYDPIMCFNKLIDK